MMTTNDSNTVIMPHSQSYFLCPHSPTHFSPISNGRHGRCSITNGFSRPTTINGCSRPSPTNPKNGPSGKCPTNSSQYVSPPPLPPSFQLSICSTFLFRRCIYYPTNLDLPPQPLLFRRVTINTLTFEKSTCIPLIPHFLQFNPISSPPPTHPLFAIDGFPPNHKSFKSLPLKNPPPPPPPSTHSQHK